MHPDHDRFSYGAHVGADGGNVLIKARLAHAVGSLSVDESRIREGWVNRTQKRWNIISIEAAINQLAIEQSIFDTAMRDLAISEHTTHEVAVRPMVIDEQSNNGTATGQAIENDTSIVGVVGFLVVTLLLVVVGAFWCSRKKRQSRSRGMTVQQRVDLHEAVVQPEKRDGDITTQHIKDIMEHI